jgi:hypothetical protein
MGSPTKILNRTQNAEPVNGSAQRAHLSPASDSAVNDEARRRAFAERVSAVVAKSPSVRKWFNETIQRWAYRIAEQEQIDSQYEDDSEHLVLLPLCVHDYTLEEKAAIVARLHDVWLAGAKPIGLPDDYMCDPGDQTIVWPYFKLVCEGASQVTSASIPCLESFLADICSELGVKLLVALDHPSILAPASGLPLQQSATQKTHAVRRSWTQPDVNKAVWKYKSERSSEYEKIRKGAECGSKGAIKSARKLFGCRAIARSIGAPHSMVSKSPAWSEIKGELKFDKLAVSKRIGFDPAMEKLAKDKWRNECQIELDDLVREQRADAKSCHVNV